MTKGLYVEVDDQVTGYCPACSSSDLDFTCMSIAGTPTYVIHKYRLSCKKSDVCALRREYMGEDE